MEETEDKHQKMETMTDKLIERRRERDQKGETGEGMGWRERELL